MNLLHLGQQIKRVRDLLGYSQEEVADKAKVGRSVLQRLERGEGNPTVSTLEALAGVLGVPLIAFFELEKGGTIPAELLSAKGAAAGLKQEQATARSKADRQDRHGDGKRLVKFGPPPIPEMSAGLDFLAKFVSLPPILQRMALTLVYQDPGYTTGIAIPPEAQAELAKLFGPLLKAKT